MTYTLDLEDQDTSKDLGDSCVYNIIDGDELQIEPVNISTNEPKTLLTMLTKPIDEESTISVNINYESQTSNIIINKSNEGVDNSQLTCSDNVCNIILFYIAFYFILFKFIMLIVSENEKYRC